MKIPKPTTYRWPPWWMFMKIETNESITGWGELIIEGQVLGVETAVNGLAEYVIGKDRRASTASGWPTTAPANLSEQRAQKHASIIASCWKQATCGDVRFAEHSISGWRTDSIH